MIVKQHGGGSYKIIEGSIDGHQKSLSTTIGLALSGILLAGIFWILNVPAGRFTRVSAGGLLLEGLVVASCLWFAEQLWRFTVGMMLEDSPAWLSSVTKIPFWYFGGGIGRVTGLLAAKSYGFFIFSDIPVCQFFTSGVAVGMAFQLFTSVIVVGLLQCHRSIHRNKTSEIHDQN